ncbi:MAG: helix-turn-helix domain-containing protein [Planctomycetaceae bacterium]
MSTSQQTIAPERLDEIRHSWPLIEAELPDLIARMEHMREASSEQSLCGELRRAVHHSGFTLAQVADRAGLDPDVLSDWLQGIHTLRSDVLDRIAQAVNATVRVTVPAREVRSVSIP